MELITPSSVWQTGTDSSLLDIFWKIRVPRVITLFFAGIGLALSGMVFQAMFRNPLATPFTLGVSSGAALGTIVHMLLPLPFMFWGISLQSLFAFSGALLSIYIVYGLSLLKQGFSSSTMLLAGVAINFFFSSLILFLQYLSDLAETFRIVRWLMGGADIVGFQPLVTAAPFIILGVGSVFYFRNELNLFTLGDELALSRGMPVKRVKIILLFIISLMVGAIVAVLGPIGFVGMMAPHICRLLTGPDHRTLSVTTLLFGGTFLVLCDTFARTLIAPAEIPVGVITALLGGPFFLWLLVRNSSAKGFF